MAEKTKTVYHPTFTDVSFDVPESNADAWKSQGYRYTPIPDAKVEKLEEQTEKATAPKATAAKA